MLHFGLEPKRLSAMGLEAIVSANSTNEAYKKRVATNPHLPTAAHAQFIGGHLTGSVARRSTFFIFRVPLMVGRVGLEPTMSLTTDLQSAALPIPLTDPYLTYIMDYIIFYCVCQEVFQLF